MRRSTSASHARGSPSRNLPPTFTTHVRAPLWSPRGKTSDKGPSPDEYGTAIRSRPVSVAGTARIIASPGLLFETRKGHAVPLLRAIICALTSGQSQSVPARRYRLCQARFQQRDHLVTIAVRVQLLRCAFERGHRSCRDHYLAALGRRSRIGQRNVLSVKLGPPELECG